MVRVEDIARAALAYDALEVRSLVQDLLREGPDWETLPRPASPDLRVLAVAAALVELLAARAGASPAPWTSSIGAVDEPIFLLRAAATMPRTRARLTEESPAPFRNRNLFVPPGYAELV